MQHAHQKGIIHRDLKPSNVLVGAERVPKIIDFGVAKATQQKLTKRTLFTEQGQLIGTPEYMSPEQAEMTAEDVDTRTDVYSLGVILYELLTGALPLDPKELRRAGFDEVRRRTDPGSWPRLLRGDLDWVTMKALEKDRARRVRCRRRGMDAVQRGRELVESCAGGRSRFRGVGF